MNTRTQRVAAVTAIAILTAFSLAAFRSSPIEPVSASALTATPTPAPPVTQAGFDQAAALSKLREQIKGHENEPSTAVFKNIQTPFIKSIPAGRLLAVMEFGYSRSLGVTCTHCHVPDKWESDDKPQKQIARDMAAMMAKINSELLPTIKNIRSERPTVNCTTCHRGEIKPALNIATPAKSQ